MCRRGGAEYAALHTAFPIQVCSALELTLPLGEGAMGCSRVGAIPSNTSTFAPQTPRVVQPGSSAKG